MDLQKNDIIICSLKVVMVLLLLFGFGVSIFLLVDYGAQDKISEAVMYAFVAIMCLGAAIVYIWMLWNKRRTGNFCG